MYICTKSHRSISSGWVNLWSLWGNLILITTERGREYVKAVGYIYSVSRHLMWQLGRSCSWWTSAQIPPRSNGIQQQGEKVCTAWSVQWRVVTFWGVGVGWGGGVPVAYTRVVNIKIQLLTADNEGILSAPWLAVRAEPYMSKLGHNRTVPRQAAYEVMWIVPLALTNFLSRLVP